ncbi:MAG: BatD family protein [Mediterranea sp.]|nr:BatD family protein [Mediterranea sp.]
MRRLYVVLTAWIACVGMALADNVTFVATAPQTVVVGDQFRLLYTVNTREVKEFKEPVIKGIDLVFGPSRSEQNIEQNINGNRSVSSSVTFTYVLMAKTAGEFTIPGTTITANGSQIMSNSVKIKVLPPDERQQTDSNTGQGAHGGGSQNAPAASGISAQDLFITATVSKSSVYEQEPLLVTYKLYSRIRPDVDNFEITSFKYPDFKGFQRQDIPSSTYTQFVPERRDGSNYYAGVLSQIVLSPQQVGKLVIDPANLEVTINRRIPGRDEWSAALNGLPLFERMKKNVSTPQITINVNSLPTGKPEGYTGGVGEFNISSSINNKSVKTNDAITIKLVISGTGNLKLMSNPEIKFPADFDVYDPKVDNNQTRLTADGLTGNKVIEYLAIPRTPGTFKIPGVTFSYFDVRAKAYKTLKTEEYTINVEKGAGNAQEVIANFTNKEDLKVLGQDIRFIKQNEVTPRPRGSFFFGTTGYWMWFLIPALLLIAAIILYRKQAAENANVAKMKTKKANKTAIKRMKLASKLLAENKKDPFYDEVLKALWGYISDKLNIPVSRLSKDNIEEKLKERGVGEEPIRQFLDALNECEFARFAPGDENQAMDKVYTASIEAISKMENSIKH